MDICLITGLQFLIHIDCFLAVCARLYTAHFRGVSVHLSEGLFVSECFQSVFNV